MWKSPKSHTIISWNWSYSPWIVALAHFDHIMWFRPTWMLTNTPWYVSYSTLLPFVSRGNSKGISVLPPGIFPALATSMLLLISWMGCNTGLIFRLVLAMVCGCFKRKAVRLRFLVLTIKIGYKTESCGSVHDCWNTGNSIRPKWPLGCWPQTA